MSRRFPLPPLRLGAPALAALLLTSSALAAPTRDATDAAKDACINANEAAQTLRAAGKLRDAEARLAVCTAPVCPGPVRDDCAERMNEVQRALPTVAFDVRGPDGASVLAARVSMDGAVLAQTLDGSAIAVDPGKHTFAIAAEGFVPLEQSLLVLEGEKARVERFVLQRSLRVDVPESGSAGQHASVSRVATVASLGIGVAGVAVGAVFGALALGNKRALDDHCTAGACPPSEQSDIQSLHTNAVFSNVGIGIGVVGLATSTILFLLSRPAAPRSAALPATRISVGPGGAGIAGTFP